MIGIDIVKIERIGRALTSQHFKERVFTQNEILYAEAKADSDQTFAGIYAAKEAAAKALGHGFHGLSPGDIEITRNAENKPEALVKGQRVYVSISHDGGFAVAIAMLAPAGG